MSDNGGGWVNVGYTHDTGFEYPTGPRERCACHIWCARKATQEDLLCDRCRETCQ